MQEEPTLIDYWRIIWKHRYLTAVLFIVAVVAAMIISLSLPKTYKSTATILSSMESPTTSSMDILRSAGVRLPGGKTTSTDIFVGILKSRQMQDDIIDRFNLMEEYKSDTRESARKSVASRTDITVSKEQMINISFIDTIPERSADIVNFYVQNLDKLNRGLNITTAGQVRRFTEERLEETKKSLQEAEDRLKEYQARNKVAGGIYSASASGATLEGRLIAKKIELEAKKKYATENNPEIIKLKNEIVEIEKSLERIPPVENELVRLLRDVKTQETVYGLLVSQYEQAKIEETRDTPTVQIIDKAVVPERKYGPKIKHNMLVSGFAALLIGIFLSFALDYRTSVLTSDSTPKTEKS